MVIGVLQFELLIRGSRSLKDKRRVVRSVKDRLHREHMVSVAEVGALDDHTLAVMGLAVAAGSTRYACAVLDRITHKLRAMHDAELGATRRDILSGDSLPDEAGTPPDDLWSAEERRAAGVAGREAGP